MDQEKYIAPSVNPWIIASVVALAAFMEVLDTSIASVALPNISGSSEPASTKAIGYSPATSSRMQ